MKRITIPDEVTRQGYCFYIVFIICHFFSSRTRERPDDREHRGESRHNDDSCVFYNMLFHVLSSARRSYNAGRQPFYRGESRDDYYRGHGSGGFRYEDRDRRREQRPERERSPPNLAPNVKGREEHHRPAYLTDKVLEHAEEIKRRKLLWQKGRVDQTKKVNFSIILSHV
jgi:hypothetical protein